MKGRGILLGAAIALLFVITVSGALAYQTTSHPPPVATAAHSRYIIELNTGPAFEKALQLRGEIAALERSREAIATASSASFGKFRDSYTEVQLDSEKSAKELQLDETAAEIERYHKDALRDMAKKVGGDFVVGSETDKLKIDRVYSRVFNGFATSASDDDVKKMQQSGYVKAVYPDRTVHALLNESVPLIGADAVWQIDADGNQCAVTGKPCLTGSGVKIAILDTGVDYTHPDLGGCLGPACKVIGGRDVINSDDDPMDDHGHGTHVAATAAGNGVLKGVAPGASVMAYKVLDEGGSGSWSQVIEGIEYAVADGADIISMSLGGSGNPDDPVSAAVDNAAEAGVVSTIAAGNSGPSSASIGSPGTARSAVTVAATDKWDGLAYFSSRGPVLWYNSSDIALSLMKPDVAAPGVNICAAEWDSAWSYRRCLDETHVAISGTSMATPHVAGAVAIITQARPDWTPEQLKAAIKAGTVDIGYKPAEMGTGRVHVPAVDLKNDPLIAWLDPLEYMPSGSLRITGMASGANMTGYELSYSSDGGNNFTVFYTSETPVYGELLGALNTAVIHDGDCLIRLRVEGTGINDSNDYGLIYVKNVDVFGPLDGDIFRLGDVVKVNMSINYANPTYSVMYGLGLDDSMLFGDGIKTIPWNSALGGVIAEWDTSSLSESGFYTIYVNISSEESGISGFIKNITVYIDSTLKEGWPVRIPYEYNPESPWSSSSRYFMVAERSWGAAAGGAARVVATDELASDSSAYSGFYYGGSFFEPVIANLSNGSEMEVVVYSGGNPPKLRAYSSNGTLLWISPVGEQETYGGNLHIPIASDINNDGYDEILAINPNTEYGSSSSLFAFSRDGSVLWNASIANDFKPTMLAADLDGDGSKEIVVKGNNAWNETMTVLDSKGNILSEWYLENSGWGATLQPSPAVGEFNDDGVFEIVSSSPTERAGYDWENMMWVNDNAVYIYDMYGGVLPGWPVHVNGSISSSPVVADIDGDRENEIVIGFTYASDIFPDYNNGGVYAFNSDGTIVPGWPFMKGYNFKSTPSVADINGDGGLEIVVSRLGFYTYALYPNGTIVEGWPQTTAWNDYYSSVIGDVSGDGHVDVVTTAGSGIHPRIDYHGGVYGWHAGGSSVEGFPKVTDYDAQAPAAIADIDGDGLSELAAGSNYDGYMFTGYPKMRGSLYVWETQADASEIPWPTFAHDTSRTACLNCNFAGSGYLSARLAFPENRKPGEAGYANITLSNKAGDISHVFVVLSYGMCPYSERLGCNYTEAYNTYISGLSNGEKQEILVPLVFDDEGDYVFKLWWNSSAGSSARYYPFTVETMYSDLGVNIIPASGAFYRGHEGSVYVEVSNNGNEAADANVSLFMGTDLCDYREIIYAIIGHYARMYIDVYGIPSLYGSDLSGGGMLSAGDPITKFKSELGSDDMWELQSGSLTDTSGNVFNYEQRIALNPARMVRDSIYGTYLDIGSTPLDPFYNYTVEFDSPLNISSNLVQNKKLGLIGASYTIGSTSGFDSGMKKLVLYGSSLVQILSGGEETEIYVDGNYYTVKLLGVSSATSAVISVNNEAQTVVKGVNYMIAGLSVYVEDVYYLSSTDQTQNSAKFAFNSDKITLEDGMTVRKGTSDMTVDGTFVRMDGTPGVGIKSVTVSVSGSGSGNSRLFSGEFFEDPVWENGFRTAFLISPNLAYTCEGMSLAGSAVVHVDGFDPRRPGENTGMVTFTAIPPFAGVLQLKAAAEAPNNIRNVSEAYASVWVSESGSNLWGEIYSEKGLLYTGVPANISARAYNNGNEVPVNGTAELFYENSGCGGTCDNLTSIGSFAVNISRYDGVEKSFIFTPDWEGYVTFVLVIRADNNIPNKERREFRVFEVRHPKDYADLQVFISSDGKLINGTENSVTVYVQNRGDQPADANVSLSVQYGACNSPENCTGMILVGSRRVSLGAYDPDLWYRSGSSVMFNVTPNITGAISLLAAASADNQAGSGNYSISNTIVVGQGADLYGYVTASPPREGRNIYLGRNASVNVTVYNNGNLPSENGSVSLYYQYGYCGEGYHMYGEPCDNLTFIGTVPVSVRPKWWSAVVPFTFVPDQLGWVSFVAFVNASNEVYQNDNIGYDRVTVSRNGPDADIDLYGSYSGGVVKGRTYDFQTAIRNIGNEDASDMNISVYEFNGTYEGRNIGRLIWNGQLNSLAPGGYRTLDFKYTPQEKGRIVLKADVSLPDDTDDKNNYVSNYMRIMNNGPDVAVTGVYGGWYVVRGRETMVGVDIENAGSSAAENVLVSLYADGRLIGNTTIYSMEFGGYNWTRFWFTPEVAGAVNLTATANFAGDIDLSDNRMNGTVRVIDIRNVTLRITNSTGGNVSRVIGGLYGQGLIWNNNTEIEFPVVVDGGSFFVQTPVDVTNPGTYGYVGTGFMITESRQRIGLISEYYDSINDTKPLFLVFANRPDFGRVMQGYGGYVDGSHSDRIGMDIRSGINYSVFACSSFNFLSRTCNTRWMENENSSFSVNVYPDGTNAHFNMVATGAEAFGVGRSFAMNWTDFDSIPGDFSLNPRFDRGGYGVISFVGAVNITELKGRQGLIQKGVGIFNGRIGIDTTYLPMFSNMSADITFGGISVSDPQILRDGLPCPPSVCSGILYDRQNGTLSLHVTGFSFYEVVEGAGCGNGVCETGETCGSCRQDCGICVVSSCGDGICGEDESCLTCVADCGQCPGGAITPPAPPGGGGGSPPGDVYVITNEQLNNGYTEVLVENDQIRFDLTGQGTMHKIKVDRVNFNNVDITIESTPMSMNLFVGDTKSADVDDDGVTDILITLNDIIGGNKASITVSHIPTIPPSGPSEPNPLSTIMGSTILLEIVAGIALLCVAAVIVWRMRKGKKSLPPTPPMPSGGGGDRKKSAKAVVEGMLAEAQSLLNDGKVAKADFTYKKMKDIYESEGISDSGLYKRIMKFYNELSKAAKKEQGK